jgi:hypothetical protein
MAAKLDIFDVLRNINNKNFNYLDQVEDPSAFTPYVVHGWLSSSTDPLQIMLLDEFVNKRYFKLAAHPELLYKLFCITARNRNMQYKWLYKKQANNDALNIVSEYLQCSKREAKLHIDSFTINDIKEMAEALGYQPAEVKKLKFT